MRRLAAVWVVALTAAPSAPAAVWLTLDRDVAHPGEIVTLSQSGVGDGVEAFLVPPGASDVADGSDSRLIPLGNTRDDKITFAVPKLDAGRYTVAVHCRPCGGTFFVEHGVDLRIERPCHATRPGWRSASVRPSSPVSRSACS